MWPNHDRWKALASGEIDVEGKPWVLSVVDCGELLLPSGKLVACDPFAIMQAGGKNEYVSVPSGRYPVRATLADVSGKRDGSHMREAYLTLTLSPAPEATRRPLTASLKGTAASELEGEEFDGFGVDAGTACLVDDDALARCMPDEREWQALFDGGPGSWFGRMDDPKHIRAGIANIALPLTKAGENIVICHSGWGDGYYPIVGGFDAGGELVAVHIDFLVVPPADEEE